MNTKLLDNWSYIHFISGFILTRIFISRGLELPYIIFIILWFEILEQSIGAKILLKIDNKLDAREHLINSLMDIVIGLIGMISAILLF